MYKKLLVLLLLLNTSVSFSQQLKISKNDNFHDLIRKNLKLETLDTAEGGLNKKLQRLNKIWGPRLYPHGDFNVAGNAMYNYTLKYNAASRKTQRKNRSIAGHDPNWRHIGLKNDANGNRCGTGRMHVIEFAPDYGVSNSTVYAGSNFGGLFRSTNGGEKWVNVNTDLLPIASVSDIVITPSDPNTIFISTGNADAGFPALEANRGGINPIFTVGIYRSKDSGNTWEALNNGRSNN